MSACWFGDDRLRVSDRHCADSIVSVLQTDGYWEASNDTGLCATPTTGDRFRAWIAADVFLNL
ncbi:hypothetical protein [Roseiflexus sp.]